MPSDKSRVAVAAPNVLAAQAALEVALQGGTAVDAAIAAMNVTYVTEPGIISALGGVYINVWPAGGDPIVIDGNVEMPGRGLPKERMGGGLREMYLDYGGGITIFAGAGSAATPGNYAAFDEATDRFGKASVADILAPAIDAARRGYRLGAAAAHYLDLVKGNLLDFDPETKAQHVHDSATPAAGTRITNPDLANALEIIAAQGFSSVHTGEIAARIAEHVQAEGGILTRADLASYSAAVRPAVRTRLGHWDIALNPPPSIGGPSLTAMLRLMSGATNSVRHTVHVQERVLRYRADNLDIAPDLEQAGRELLVALKEGRLSGLPTSTDTAHVSVVDASGMACAMTSSAGYSSGVTIPGTGLILNNSLGEPELNRRGLHTLAPGTRLASNMSPTTARDDLGGVLAIGTPGADRITTALMQVITRYTTGGVGLQEAVDAPRVHVELRDGEMVLHYEPDESVAAAVAAEGWTAVPHGANDMYFGGVGAAQLTHDGRFLAAADPRRAAATVTG